MMNYIKNAFGDTVNQEVKQSVSVEQAKKYHGGRAYAEVLNYEAQRQLKQRYIQEHLVGQGYEIEGFLQLLGKEKQQGPNIDFFNIEDIVELVQKYKQSSFPDTEGDLNRSIGLNSSRASMNSDFFERNLNRSSSRSSIRSTLSKKSQRRETLKVEGTILNRHKQVVCMVQESAQFITSTIGKYVQNSSMMFEIVTHPFKWKVKRQDSDFRALREYLVRVYPQTIVPPLPKIKPKKRLTKKQLYKKQQYHQRFLTQVLKSQVMRASDYLVEFLSLKTLEQFQMKAFSRAQDKGPNSLLQFKTLTGEIDLQATQPARDLCDNLDNFLKSSTEINNFITKKCKVIQAKAHQLADEYYGVGSEILRLAKLYEKTNVPQIVMLYDKVSTQVIKNGDFLLQQGELMNNQISGWFKLHREEREAIDEAKRLQYDFKEKFEKKSAALFIQKQKLFKFQDVQLWGTSHSDIKEALISRHDPEKAFAFMLPKSTREVEILKEENEYFTNQYYKEMRRMTMMDYEMARENFVNVGEMNLKHIYELNLGWQQFLSFYTDTNVERKQYDERYQIETGIGEEVDDPEEELEDENDLAFSTDDIITKQQNVIDGEALDDSTKQPEEEATPPSLDQKENPTNDIEEETKEHGEGN